MSKRTPVEPEVRIYWRALADLDEVRADEWLKSIYALAANDASAAPRRLERLIPALQLWQTWARAIGSECIEHPERATVAVHHLDIACHPLVMVHALHAHPYVARRWGETTGNRFFALAQSITEKYGDLGESAVRREAAGNGQLSESDWTRCWLDAERTVARLSSFIEELIGAQSGGDHA